MSRCTILAMLLVACGGGKTEAGLDDDYTWEGGLFEMTSYAVEDNCTDNAFVPLLLPEGEGSTNAWAYPIEIPSWAEMEESVTYEIQLQEPFSNMEVTVTHGAATGQVDMIGSGQDDVLFNEDSGDDCVVDMNISAIIVLSGPDNVQGYAKLRITDARGDTCPDFDGDPCDVDLDFTGLRLE